MGVPLPIALLPRSRLVAAGLAGIFTIVGWPAAAQDPVRGQAAACVSCVVLHLPAAALPHLGTLPSGALDGLTLVVERPSASDAFGGPALRATGATVGLLLSADAEMPPASVVGEAPVIVLTSVEDSDQGIYRARTLITTVRAAAPEVRVLIASPRVPARLAGYVDGRVEPGPRLRHASAEALVQLSLDGGTTAVLVTIDEPDPQALAAFAARRALSSDVTADAPLDVDEILARHQARQRRQAQLVRRTIARGRTALVFEAPGFVAPVRITAETAIYTQPGLVEIEQRDIRVNGAAIAGGDAAAPPRLPLIEPERVAVPPLTIALNEAYRYSLAGRERIDGAVAYVVGFSGPGAHGRAWIDSTTFALRRLETIQARLTGAIVSSEQHERFAPFQVDGDTVWLPARVSVFQMYEGAGHRTPIHREIETPVYEINPPDFDVQLRAAHDSPHVMLRDTPDGFRYLLRERSESADTAVARTIAPRAGERIRTAVAGILVDPNITVPLPFAGLSYVDLNLLGTGAQLNAFFGGTFGQLSWSVPSIAGTRLQAHGRVFAIGASYNDRSFRGGIERYEENITQRPAHASAGILRPLTARVRMRLAYELDYTGFDRGDTTDARFVVPVDAVVHGLVAAIDAASGPWTARVWWNPATRGRWRSWGLPDADVDARAARSFQRFGVSAARTLALGRRIDSRLELAWMDSVDLDRFSRYSFNAFDNRLRGYPTASIRYDRGAVLRTAASWSAAGVRLNGFGDLAVVRDPGLGDALRGYPGIGAALETAGPLRTLWSVEWGYGFRATREDGGTGTHAIRITAYRTF